jgi:hypothetical protein
MIQPNEMKSPRPMRLHDGVIAMTIDVWNMPSASRDGDLIRMQVLAEQCPALLTCQYDYTCPLHLAVREGHLELVRYLVEQGGIDPNYKMHPFQETLLTCAEDRFPYSKPSWKKKIFALRPWRSFLPGIGSARSPPMNNNDDIPTTDTTEIKQLINRVKRGELDQGDAQLIEKLLNILTTVSSSVSIGTEEIISIFSFLSTAVSFCYKEG